MTEPFETQLRTRGAGVDLSDGAGDAFVIRAQVLEAWDAVRVRVRPRTTIAAVKQAALEALLADAADASGYMAKVRGHEVRDETLALAEADVRPGTTVLVHARRRRPVR